MIPSLLNGPIESLTLVKDAEPSLPIVAFTVFVVEASGALAIEITGSPVVLE